MKRILVIGSFFVMVLALTVSRAEAIPIFYNYGDEFELLCEFPDSTTNDDGDQLSFGIKFEQFSVFSIPLWNYGVAEYVLFYDKDEDVFYYDDLSDEELETFFDFSEECYDVTLPEDPKLSFWNRIGGKLVGLGALLAILIIYGKLNNNKESKEDTPENTPKEIA